MANIPLRSKDGSVRDYVIVDDCDFEYLNQFRWCLSNGYAMRTKRINDKSTKIRMHREIAERMGLDMSNTIDHKDRVKLNNRRNNLRPATRHQQSVNRGKQCNNKLGIKGVSWHKQRKKFQAYIRINGKNKFLGYFDDKFEAAMKYALYDFRYNGVFSGWERITIRR